MKSKFISFETKDKSNNEENSFDCSLALPSPYTGYCDTISFISLEIPQSYNNIRSPYNSCEVNAVITRTTYTTVTTTTPTTITTTIPNTTIEYKSNIFYVSNTNNTQAFQLNKYNIGSIEYENVVITNGLYYSINDLITEIQTKLRAKVVSYFGTTTSILPVLAVVNNKVQMTSLADTTNNFFVYCVQPATNSYMRDIGFNFWQNEVVIQNGLIVSQTGQYDYNFGAISAGSYYLESPYNTLTISVQTPDRANGYYTITSSNKSCTFNVKFFDFATFKNKTTSVNIILTEGTYTYSSLLSTIKTKLNSGFTYYFFVYDTTSAYKTRILIDGGLFITFFLTNYSGSYMQLLGYSGTETGTSSVPRLVATNVYYKGFSGSTTSTTIMKTMSLTTGVNTYQSVLSQIQTYLNANFTLESYTYAVSENYYNVMYISPQTTYVMSPYFLLSGYVATLLGFTSTTYSQKLYNLASGGLYQGIKATTTYTTETTTTYETTSTINAETSVEDLTETITIDEGLYGIDTLINEFKNKLITAFDLSSSILDMGYDTITYKTYLTTTDNSVVWKINTSDYPVDIARMLGFDGSEVASTNLLSTNVHYINHDLYFCFIIQNLPKNYGNNMTFKVPITEASGTIYFDFVNLGLTQLIDIHDNIHLSYLKIKMLDRYGNSLINYNDFSFTLEIK
jgi:hypothetical protein